MLSIEREHTGAAMYRVSDVLKPDFARSWHEAVAIVQEVASQLVPGGTVPDADDLLFDEAGEIQLGFGPDAPQNPVRALGGLLTSLLDGVDAPVGLRDLAASNAGPTPSHSSVPSFQKALAFYERPVRANDLQAIASRLRGLPVESPESAFEQLRERVAAKAQGQPEPKPEPAAKRQPKVSRHVAIAAGVLALAVAGAFMVYARPRYLADRAEQKLADTISSGLDKIGMADAPGAGAPPLAEAPEPGTIADAKGTPSKASPSAGTSPQKLRANPAEGTPSLAVKGQLPMVGAPIEDPGYAERDAGRAPAALPPPIVPSPGHLEDGLVTYTAADREVLPPRLSRQQLPRQPEPGDDTGYFDVTVNENGDVDHVQLLSPMRRFQERMLMAAAKAWKFKPALRDGQPVRYRIRIPIILADKP